MIEGYFAKTTKFNLLNFLTKFIKNIGIARTCNGIFEIFSLQDQQILNGDK